MCYKNIGTSKRRKKIQATPTKQDLGTSYGFFSKFPMSIPVFPAHGMIGYLTMKYSLLKLSTGGGVNRNTQDYLFSMIGTNLDKD